MSVMLWLLAGYYALTVASYWAPLIGYRFGRRPQAAYSVRPVADSALPYLVAVAPTRASPGSIAGIVETLRRQAYPPSRFRTIILVDPEGPDDPSARIAQAAGAEVFERQNVHVRTKGAGLNELLASLRLRFWDAVIVLDIDARVEPLFFRKIAAYLKRGDLILQGAPVGKNAGGNAMARLSDAAQDLANMIQQGREALGLLPSLSGTGMVFSRSAMQRLDWQTSLGQHLSDDGELNLRCYLKDLRVTYAPDLVLWNDLPEDAGAVRQQRRRWMAAYMELIPPYSGRLLRKALRGHWRVLEGTFNLLFLPSCSLSFACGGAATLALAAAAWRSGMLRPWGILAASLFTLHALYYALALRTIGFVWSVNELSHLPEFLAMRAAAIWDGVRLACLPNPGDVAPPASHADDTSPLSQIKGGDSS